MWYFIRHAESTANLAKILGGQGDYPLTASGRSQAQTIGRQIGRRWGNFDKIVSSPQPRAWQTAEEIAAALSFPLQRIVAESALKEHNIGRFTGMPYHQAITAPDYQSEVSKRWYWRPAGGESYAEIARRVQRLLYSYQPYRGEKILFVTHAVTMRLIHGVLSRTLPDYPTEVCHNGEIWACDFQSLQTAHQIAVHRFAGTTAHRP